MTKIFINNLSDLLEIQRASFYRFLQKGIGKEFKNLPNPIFCQIQESLSQIGNNRKKLHTFTIQSSQKNLENNVLKKNIINIPKVQKNIFYSISKSFTLNKILISKNLEIQKKYECIIYLHPSKIQIHGPLHSLNTCIKLSETYKSNIFIEGEIILNFIQAYKKNLINYLETYKYISNNLNIQILKNLEPFLKKVSFYKSFYLLTIPILTDDGCFFINGCERIIVSQTIRSPGIYFKKEYLSSTKTEFNAIIISAHGHRTKIYLNDSVSQLDLLNNTQKEIQSEEHKSFSSEILGNIIPRTYDIYFKFKELRLKNYRNNEKAPQELHILDLLSAYGYNYKDIAQELKYPNKISWTGLYKNSQEPIYRQKYNSIEYKKNRYLKVWKKYLRVSNPIKWNSFIDHNLALIFSKDVQNFKIDEQKYIKKLNSSVNIIKSVPFFNTIQYYLKTFISQLKGGVFNVGEIGRYRINQKLDLKLPLNTTVLTALDIFAIINNLIEFKENNLKQDDIDNLKNKQIRAVGDLLQNQLKIAIDRWRISPKISDSILYSLQQDTSNQENLDLISVQKYLKNIKIKNYRFSKYTLNQKNNFTYNINLFRFANFFKSLVFSGSLRSFINNSFREFLLTSPLSQFYDQTNPLAELAHKRRISVFGPNGFQRDNISIKMRDIHPSQYGRICPVETPEGENAGLVMSLSSYARVSEFGWIETPCVLIKDANTLSNKKIFYLNPDHDNLFKIAFPNNLVKTNQKFSTDYISAKEGPYFVEIKANDIEFSIFSPLQIFSIGTNLVPFVEHNDANRALMGSNMQRQAVPLLITQNPIIGTGFESNVALEAGTVVISESEALVKYASSSQIILIDLNNQFINYKLNKYYSSNQETCINQKPSVWIGEKIYSGQIIAEGAASNQGEFAVGKNLNIAYLPWEGYNYEDAIVINEDLIHSNILTSIHVFEHEIDLNLRDIHNIKYKLLLPFLQQYKRLNQMLLKINLMKELSLKNLKNNNIFVYKKNILNSLNLIRVKLNLLEESILENENFLNKDKLMQNLAHLDIPYSKWKNLGVTGIIQNGSYIKEGDILVGKATLGLTNDVTENYEKLYEILTESNLDHNSSEININSFNNSEKTYLDLINKKSKYIQISDFVKLEFTGLLLKRQFLKAFICKIVKEKSYIKIFKYIYGLLFKTYLNMYSIVKNFNNNKLFYKVILKKIEFLLLTYLHLYKSTLKQNIFNKNWQIKYFKLFLMLENELKSFINKINIVDLKQNLNKKNLNLDNIYYQDTSHIVPLGFDGTITNIKILPVNSKANKQSNSSCILRFTIAEISKIKIGDKLSGRHGNKGVISKILPKQDMPILPNGTAIDILLNPLGVPSRMNIGQLLESTLGLAGLYLNTRFKIRPFDEIFGKEASKIFVNQKLKEASLISKNDWLYEDESPGKVYLRDGRTGEFFDNPISIGNAYILKLIHLVEDKITARATGPYTLIEEQPISGKSRGGGQRFGEMEVWALEAYGSTHILQELLTIKSDDIDGRLDTYEAIVSGTLGVKPLSSLSETFIGIIRHLNSLGLEFNLSQNLKNYTMLSTSKLSEKHTIKNYNIDIFSILETKLKLRKGALDETKYLSKNFEYLKGLNTLINEHFYQKFEINNTLNIFNSKN